MSDPTRDQAYQVDLTIERARSTAAGLYDIALYDRERVGVGTHVPDAARLEFDDQAVPNTTLTARRLLELFLDGHDLGRDDALALGRFVEARLFETAPLRDLWQCIHDLRGARPLRLEVQIPASDVESVADIPFELLADEKGFIFRRPGAILVRAIQGMRVAEFRVPPGAGVAVAWANPANAHRIGGEVLRQHEDIAQRAAPRLGWRSRPSCRSASLRSLEAHLKDAHAGTPPILSLVAHGSPNGGSVLLHDDRHPSFPDDPGESVAARDLASSLRSAGIKVAFLWSCHGARRHPTAGSVASALLDPELGDLAAVLASQAALWGAHTPRLFERLLDGLLTAPDGDLERAVAAARAALPEAEAQWAAPVYYARSRGPRSVTWERTPPAAVTDTEPRSPGLEYAPPPSPHFRGRDHEVTECVAKLRASRLVSVTGLPGMGKTEVALAAARRATAGEVAGLQRGVWIPLDGVTDSAGLRARVAVVLGLDTQRCADDHGLATSLRDARLLLVLDNAEDPLRADLAACRNLLSTLLRGVAGLRLLLATRLQVGDLAEAFEEEVRVQQLAPEAARSAFISATGPRLREAERTHTDLDRLLAWLDGHPLSLMLVARQVGQMPLPDLVKRLEAGEHALVADPWLDDVEQGPDAAARRQRLASSLNLSLEPLRQRHPAAAEMFAWLGLYPAGLPAILAPMVFGPGAEAERARLLRLHLAEEHGRDQRLTLPAPIRAYARAQIDGLDAGRRAELWVSAMEALAAWYAESHRLLQSGAGHEAVGSAVSEAPNLDIVVGTASPRALESHEHGPRVARALSVIAPAGAQLLSYAGRPTHMAVMAEELAKLRLKPTRCWRRPSWAGALPAE